MELINFDKYRQTLGTFDGNAGKKVEIIFNEEKWIIKYPRNTKEMEGILFSYPDSPISEYIGSHIYVELGIPVHETLLGERDGKIVVACKNFLNPGERLIEFAKIKNMYDPRLEKISDNDLSKGSSGGSDLFVTLEEIRNNVITSCVTGIEERFWDMFVIDSLISNEERSNDNWGLIEKENGSIVLAPVYDNGDAFSKIFLSATMSYDSLTLSIQDDIKNTLSFYTQDNKNIRPFDFIARNNIPEELYSAILRYKEKVVIEKIYKIIEEIPEYYKNQLIFPVKHKEYLKETIKKRDEILQNILKMRI